jgi:hypothetical protein
MVTLFLANGKTLVFPTGIKVEGCNFTSYSNAPSVTVFGEQDVLIAQFLINHVAGYVIGEGAYHDAELSPDAPAAPTTAAAPSELESTASQLGGELTGYERGREG